MKQSLPSRELQLSEKEDTSQFRGRLSTSVILNWVDTISDKGHLAVVMPGELEGGISPGNQQQFVLF